MKRKVFATSCLAGMVIIGAAAMANTAPNPGESGPLDVEYTDDFDDTRNRTDVSGSQ